MVFHEFIVSSCGKRSLRSPPLLLFFSVAVVGICKCKYIIQVLLISIACNYITQVLLLIRLYFIQPFLTPLRFYSPPPPLPHINIHSIHNHSQVYSSILTRSHFFALRLLKKKIINMQRTCFTVLGKIRLSVARQIKYTLFRNFLHLKKITVFQRT